MRTARQVRMALISAGEPARPWRKPPERRGPSRLHHRVYRAAAVCALVGSCLGAGGCRGSSGPPRPGAAATQPYVGNTASGVVHRRGCGFIGRGLPRNLRGFPDLQAARAAGLRPCRRCLGEEPASRGGRP